MIVIAHPPPFATECSRLWLEALCCRWQDGLFVRYVCTIVSKWRSHARSRRFSRLAWQRAMHKMACRTSSMKQRALLCWCLFQHSAARKRRMLKSAHVTVHRKTHAFMRCLLSKWLQYSKQRQQVRVLKQAINRTCERTLQTKNHNSLRSILCKWHFFSAKRRARRASCCRVEFNAQVHLYALS